MFLALNHESTMILIINFLSWFNQQKEIINFSLGISVSHICFFFKKLIFNRNVTTALIYISSVDSLRIYDLFSVFIRFLTLFLSYLINFRNFRSILLKFSSTIDLIIFYQFFTSNSIYKSKSKNFIAHKNQFDVI